MPCLSNKGKLKFYASQLSFYNLINFQNAKSHPSLTKTKISMPKRTFGPLTTTIFAWEPSFLAIIAALFGPCV